MDVMAILLASLRRYHRPFVIALIDQIFEEIQRSCEKNDFKESQRRIALIKFIGECYNFRVVRTSTLFDLLYRLININWEMAVFTTKQVHKIINEYYYGEETADASEPKSMVWL